MSNVENETLKDKILEVLEHLTFIVFFLIVGVFSIAGFNVAGGMGFAIGLVIGLVTSVFSTGFFFLLLNINENINSIRISLKTDEQ